MGCCINWYPFSIQIITWTFCYKLCVSVDMDVMPIVRADRFALILANVADMAVISQTMTIPAGAIADSQNNILDAISGALGNI